ncbi:Methyltransferase type 11 [Ancylobacter novellus DSM 506]|uniref:Methyltransferase type 11 n=2 Tax=Ancylobacter novellus TaxID=921 RepID=D7A9F5_ANCN5|nr:Methyltransferase type 11 [Ancylobacter novellus DSM 506]
MVRCWMNYALFDWFNRRLRKFPEPIARIRSRAEWDAFQAGSAKRKIDEYDNSVIEAHRHDQEWVFRGYSEPAQSEVDFIVDLQWGGRTENGKSIPNLRERLSCPITELNNRQRLIATLLKNQTKSTSRAPDIYFMEEVTAIFHWSVANLENVSSITGSEYLGHEYKSGDIVNGIHHEDIHDLSFDDASFDLIVSNEVFEHIPSPTIAFGECHRVLRPGGEMLMTTPFFVGYDQSLQRARIVDGQLEHLLPPAYHGNPVSNEGSLVFFDFGWDIFDMARDGGFSDCVIELYHSPRFGHLTVQTVFRLRK